MMKTIMCNLGIEEHGEMKKLFLNDMAFPLAADGRNRLRI
jgi:hypothetical protein